MSSYATHETTERDDLLFGDDILEVLGRWLESRRGLVDVAVDIADQLVELASSLVWQA